jgi:uncharacterized membrane protein
MEVIGILIAFGIMIFFIAAPIIALVRASGARTAAGKIEKELEELKNRAHTLDRAVAEARDLKSRLVSLETEIKTLKDNLASAEHQPVPAPAPPIAAGPPAKPETQTPPAVPAAPPAPSAIAAEPLPGAVAGKRAKATWNIEETLGTNWLNKLGIVILVIGVALFLGYQLQHVGPAGKVFVGFLISAAMLAGGAFFERRERWQVLARAGLGGGWALLFFTTYAMNHLPAASVLKSESADFFLLFLVGVAMVAHTLRYQSQVVSGLAFLLAFSAINLSHGSVSGLWAGVILCAGLALIAVRRNWFELEIFGLLAAYLSHYYWLRPIIEPMGAHHHPFPELTASTWLLIAYWLIFRSSYIARRVEAKYQENVSTVAALLNTFLFHGVIAYQAARPELAFPFLLGVGSTEMVLAQLPITRRRRTAFVILSTIGAVLLVAAFSYRYSGGRLSIIWLLEAEALILAGIFTHEILFRRLGMLAAALAAGHMMFVDALKLAQARDLRGYDFADLRTTLIFAVAALVLYADSHAFLRRPPDLITTRVDEWGTQALSYVAGIMAMLAVWSALTEMWWTVGWAALAVAAAIAATRWKFKQLAFQASAFALLGVIRALVVNLADPWALPGHAWLTRRLIAVSVVATLVYNSARSGEVKEWPLLRRVSQIHTWTGSFVVAILLWYELRPISVALGWMMFGLLLFEFGVARRSWCLRLQSYAALTASFMRLFYVNLNAAGYPGEISPRVYATLPLAAGFLYVYWRLETLRDEPFQEDRRFLVGNCAGFFATLTVAALMRFELDADYVAAAWAALALILIVVAWRFGKAIFLHQGLLLGFAVLFRGFLHNIYERSYFPAPFWHGRMFSVGLAVALLFLALPVTFLLKRKTVMKEAEPAKWPARAIGAPIERPDQVFFFIPFLLLTVLLGVEMRSGMVTLAWGVEAVAVFLFALWVGQRSFRLSGVGLLLICAGKIVVLDVWSLQPRDRYLTFIVLGIALTSVSFLYTRYRETLRQYL